MDTLVVFVGDRAVYVGRAENLKPHAILGQPELGKTGFEFELPPSLLPAPESGQRVRVFALRGHDCVGAPLRRRVSLALTGELEERQEVGELDQRRLRQVVAAARGLVQQRRLPRRAPAPCRFQARVLLQHGRDRRPQLGQRRPSRAGAGGPAA